MSIWGMGYKFDGHDDQSLDFIKQGKAVLDWGIDDAPDVHAMFRDIRKGDIIYLKTISVIKGEGHKVRIRAIGVVKTDLQELESQALKFLISAESQNLTELIEKQKAKQTEIEVGWIDKIGISVPYDIKKINGKNNVYLNTLYREYNPTIIKDIIERISPEDEKE